MKEEATRIEYRGVPVDITITWNYFHSTSVDHIEIETLDDHPLPMTETGYYSHFCHFGENFTMAEAVEWFAAVIPPTMRATKSNHSDCANPITT